MIDSHHHLWNYTTEDYGWIDDRMSVIARDFTPADLLAVARPVGVTGTVAVQARQSLEETRWLLRLAEDYPEVLGVVGWAPLAADGVDAVLDEFAGNPRLKGYRHVVQDEPDDDFILGDAFNRGVERVLARGLTYDILIFARHLPQATAFVDRHPAGRFVLDHVAKPSIARGELQPWRDAITELARRENVACKISGMVTEDDWSAWSPDTLRPYLDATLEAFGPSRLMFGSDWPVCLVASRYETWIQTVQQWAAPLSDDERQSLFVGAATTAYQLDPQAA